MRWYHFVWQLRQKCSKINQLTTRTSVLCAQRSAVRGSYIVPPFVFLSTAILHPNLAVDSLKSLCVNSPVYSTRASHIISSPLVHVYSKRQHGKAVKMHPNPLLPLLPTLSFSSSTLSLVQKKKIPKF